MHHRIMRKKTVTLLNLEIQIRLTVASRTVGLGDNEAQFNFWVAIIWTGYEKDMGQQQVYSTV